MGVSDVLRQTFEAVFFLTFLISLTKIVEHANFLVVFEFEIIIYLLNIDENSFDYDTYAVLMSSWYDMEHPQKFIRLK